MSSLSIYLFILFIFLCNLIQQNIKDKQWEVGGFLFWDVPRDWDGYLHPVSWTVTVGAWLATVRGGVVTSWLVAGSSRQWSAEYSMVECPSGNLETQVPFVTPVCLLGLSAELSTNHLYQEYPYYPAHLVYWFSFMYLCHCASIPKEDTTW